MYSYGENKGSTSNKCTHSTNGVYLYGIVLVAWIFAGKKPSFFPIPLRQGLVF